MRAAALEAANKKPASKAEPKVHIETSEAVKAAMEASEMYGKTSKEAQLAWSLVEEMDAANAHHRPTDIHVNGQESAATEPAAPAKEPTVLSKEPPKTVEEAIKAASLASEIYGKHSTEARLAWELVEEMDSTKSHVKDSEAAKKAAEEASAAKEKQSASKPSGPVVQKDATEAIKAAMAASKEFGPTSAEARMAWELVEEIDAANAHHKSVGTG